MMRNPTCWKRVRNWPKRRRARKAAMSRIAEARYQLDRSQIMAPFSGVVIEVNTIPGEYIQAGTAVVRLLDTSSFEVQASVPSRYVPALEPGQTMQATLETGAELTLTCARSCRWKTRQHEPGRCVLPRPTWAVSRMWRWSVRDRPDPRR